MLACAKSARDEANTTRTILYCEREVRTRELDLRRSELGAKMAGFRNLFKPSWSSVSRFGILKEELENWVYFASRLKIFAEFEERIEDDDWILRILLQINHESWLNLLLIESLCNLEFDNYVVKLLLYWIQFSYAFYSILCLMIVLPWSSKNWY
jgi:hypothetical protein